MTGIGNLNQRRGGGGSPLGKDKQASLVNYSIIYLLFVIFMYIIKYV
jgi:hypothetical protein